MALLALWLPPVLYCVAVDIGLVEGSGGIPTWIDPNTSMPVVELSAMIAAVPRLIERKESGRALLVFSRVAVLLRDALD